MRGPFLYDAMHGYRDLVGKLTTNNVQFTLVIGAPSSGKSTVLSNLERALADPHNPGRIIRLRALQLSAYLNVGVESTPALALGRAEKELLVSAIRRCQIIVVDDLHHLIELPDTAIRVESIFRDWIESENKCLVCSTSNEMLIRRSKAFKDSPIFNYYHPVFLLPTELYSLKPIKYASIAQEFLARMLADRHITPIGPVDDHVRRAVSQSGGHPLLLAVSCDLALTRIIAATDHATNHFSTDDATVENRHIRQATETFIRNIFRWAREGISLDCRNRIASWDLTQGKFPVNKLGAEDRKQLCLSGLFSLIEIGEKDQREYVPFKVESEIIRQVVTETLLEEFTTRAELPSARGDTIDRVPATDHHNAVALVSAKWISYGESEEWGVAELPNQKLTFGKQEWKIIQAMRRKPGELVQVNELLSLIGENSERGESLKARDAALRSTISRLKVKLNAAGLPSLLTNIKRRGYIWSDRVD